MERSKSIKEAFDRSMNVRGARVPLSLVRVISPEVTRELDSLGLHIYYADKINQMIHMSKKGEREEMAPLAKELALFGQETKQYLGKVDPDNTYENKHLILGMIEGSFLERINYELHRGKHDYIAKMLTERGIDLDYIPSLSAEDKNTLLRKQEEILAERTNIKSLLGDIGGSERLSREALLLRVKDYLLVFPDHIGEMSAKGLMGTIETSIEMRGAEATASKDMYNLPLDLVKDIENMMEQEGTPVSVGAKL